VVNGTTGESPTTTDAEKNQLLRAVVDAVGDRAAVVAGVGTNDTRHSVELARAAEKAGAHGLLLVSPYYNKPPQAGLVAHFTAVADATGLPVMLYDIPGRTGVPIETATLVRLAAHPRIVAVKDAKDDLGAASRVLAQTDLAFYSGTDVLNLPLLSVGGCGVVSVVGHVATPVIRDMISAFASGDVARARALHQRLLPAYQGIFRSQGVILAKAALAMAGLPAGPVRPRSWTRPQPNAPGCGPTSPPPTSPSTPTTPTSAPMHMPTPPPATPPAWDPSGRSPREPQPCEFRESSESSEFQRRTTRPPSSSARRRRSHRTACVSSPSAGSARSAGT
jgi:4-hydroxy-tetrahydrodipicolinate synthase